MEIANSGGPEPRTYMEIALELFRSIPSAIGNHFDMMFPCTSIYFEHFTQQRHVGTTHLSGSLSENVDGK